MFESLFNIVPQQFEVVDGDDNPCSTREFVHFLYLSTVEEGATSLARDTVKYRAGNENFLYIAEYLCEYYSAAGADFKRYVSCSNLPLCTDYFQRGAVALEVRGEN